MTDETSRTEKYAICRHGISLLDRCVECELRLAMRDINRWGPVVAEARKTVDELTVPVNQCDGCRVDAPLSPRGNHQMPDGGFMGCTKDRYVEPEAERTVRELTELVGEVKT